VATYTVQAELTSKGRNRLDVLKDKMDRSDLALSEFIKEDMGLMYVLSYVDDTGHLPAETPEPLLREVVGNELVDIDLEEAPLVKGPVASYG